MARKADQVIQHLRCKPLRPVDLSSTRCSKTETQVSRRTASAQDCRRWCTLDGQGAPGRRVSKVQAVHTLEGRRRQITNKERIRVQTDCEARRGRNTPVHSLPRRTFRPERRKSIGRSRVTRTQELPDKSVGGVPEQGSVRSILAFWKRQESVRRVRPSAHQGKEARGRANTDAEGAVA